MPGETAAEAKERIFEEAVRYLAIAELYAALKLEPMLHLARAVLIGARAMDDHFATFEWGSGGIVHLHIVAWLQGTPRSDIPEGDIPEGAAHLHLEHEAVEEVARFFTPLISETNPKKPPAGEETRICDRQQAKLANGRMHDLADPCKIDWGSFSCILLAGLKRSGSVECRSPSPAVFWTDRCRSAPATLSCRRGPAGCALRASPPRTINGSCPAPFAVGRVRARTNAAANYRTETCSVSGRLLETGATC